MAAKMNKKVMEAFLNTLPMPLNILGQIVTHNFPSQISAVYEVVVKLAAMTVATYLVKRTCSHFHS